MFLYQKSGLLLIISSSGAAAKLFLGSVSPRFIWLFQEEFQHLILFKIKSMNLEDSRASSALKKNMKSTRGSFFTKVTGREMKASWGNRIVKDFNDLDYDVSIDRFSKNNRFKNSDVMKRRKIQADLRSRRNSRKKIQADGARSESPNKRRSNSLSNPGMALNAPIPNPERIYISTIETPANKFYGLCPHQHVNTIQGRMDHRLNHHIAFNKNKVNRSVNQNPVYYNRHEDLDFSFSQVLHDRKELKKYHPFPSYTQRRVFEPKDELDKFYDDDHSRKAASPPRRSREAVRNFERVVGRMEPKLNESVALAYQTIPCLQKIESSSQKYSIPNTVRETEFLRQVIDSKRGCYR